MTDDGEFEFIARLRDFGLSQKEARLYHHLLKYAAKPPAVIARHLHTYREDVHRTLTTLIEKGMVRPSLSAPTVYAAVDLDIALNSAVKKHESELREMEARKRELAELAEAMAMERAPPEPADGCSYRVLRGPNELNTLSIELMSRATSDISMLMPGAVLPIFNRIGVLDMVPDAARRGVRMRLLTDISDANLESGRYILEHGVELRHAEPSGGLQFAVHDAKKSVVFIRFDPTRGMLDTSVAAFLCGSPTYAGYLLFHYEHAWKQAVDGAERIRALVESGQ
ncbi:MAG: TrmB family transcriptional regulator [Halobacteriota archaeon]